MSMASNARAAVVLAAFAALAACGEMPNQVSSTASGGQTHPPLPTPTPVGIQTPAPGSIFLGAFVPGAAGIPGLEASVNRTLAIDADYRNWVSKVPSSQANDDLRNGRIYFGSWDCGISDFAVAAGQDDALITTTALAIKKYGHTVFLRYMWDPNTTPASMQRQECYDVSTDNEDGTFSPVQYVKAYRHIHQIFVNNGVNNVDWVWSFNPAGSNDPVPYYPGDDVVDWIGIDAYATAATFTSFSQLLSAPYALFSGHNKPMIVSEAGASPALQVTFLTGAPQTLHSQFPQIQGFVYFDGTTPNGVNWSLGASGGAQFTKFANDPYMTAMPSGV